MERKLERWAPGECYAGDDYSDSFVFLGQNRDSAALDRSNFQVGLEELGGTSETVRVGHFGHWACGWVELILIHESDLEAQATAEKLLRKLEDYPVLDEDHWSELEWTEGAEYWANAGLRERIDMCHGAGISGYAARRADEVPSEVVHYLAEA